eukprot:366018-Chlamydomonas_euryale.AAC.9
MYACKTVELQPPRIHSLTRERRCSLRSLREKARRRSPTGRAELFILDGSPDGRGPPAGGPRPASRDPSRDRRRTRDPPRDGCRKRDPSATRTVGTPPAA